MSKKDSEKTEKPPADAGKDAETEKRMLAQRVSKSSFHAGKALTNTKWRKHSSLVKPIKRKCERIRN